LKHNRIEKLYFATTLTQRPLVRYSNSLMIWISFPVNGDVHIVKAWYGGACIDRA